MNAAEEARGADQLRWFKSSYSSGEGGECVEVAMTPTVVHVRDSKVGAESPRLGVTAEAWDAFVTDL
jgi:hypothetical protein